MQSETEHADAGKVDEALAHLHVWNTPEAESILLDVCSRCPDDFRYEYVEDDTRYIKFWDMPEFMEYVAAQPEESGENITWLPSAYPRACYHLAFLCIEKGDFRGAIQWLGKGRSMEPRNPKFLLEAGVAYAHLEEHQNAMARYHEALDLPGISVHGRAVALRGLGVQLIILGRLDEAEARLKESLALEPDNANARHDLMHISHLRAGSDLP